jgi:hypothetical protein
VNPKIGQINKSSFFVKELGIPPGSFHLLWFCFIGNVNLLCLFFVTFCFLWYNFVHVIVVIIHQVCCGVDVKADLSFFLFRIFRQKSNCMKRKLFVGLLIAVLSCTPFISDAQVGSLNQRLILPSNTGIGNHNGTVVLAQAGEYHLDFQTDLNLVLYKGSTAIWASGTARSSWSNGFVYFHGNGMVEISSSNTWWHSEVFPGGYRCIWELTYYGDLRAYPDYKLWDFGVIGPVGEAFAHTNTAGGQQSDRYGRLY